MRCIPYRRLDDDEKGMSSIHTLDEDEDRTVNDSFTVNGTSIIHINESGFYSLCFGSCKKETRLDDDEKAAVSLTDISSNGVEQT